MASHISLDDSDRIGALLTRHDPPPVRIINPAGAASFLLLGDHAGDRIPSALGDLGVATADRARHIGWDIGVGALGERLAVLLDAPFVRQTYSRLVVDCHRPYQVAIAAQIVARAKAARATILVSLHSFTPTMRGVARPWEIGILHDVGDPSFAHACLAWLRAQTARVIGDNEPYRMDRIDYTVPLHAYPAGLRYVEIEVRQDLLGDADGIAEIASTFATMLTAAAAA